jgi:hypothetical protein
MRMVQKNKPGWLTVAWEANDPNDDDLRYEVWYQLYGQNDWHLLAQNLNQPLYSFDTATLADGRYHFRVYADDHLSNPGNGYRVFHDSELIQIDNTPPEIHNLNAESNGQEVEVSFDGEDKLSPLAYADYALDGKPGDLLKPVDGIVDSRQESFRFRLTASKGEHLLSVKLTDRLGNITTATTNFEIR